MGTTKKLNNVIVLGMLTQIKHGKYSLEDPTGCVDLDLTNAKFHRGLYTENCFVLVEGKYHHCTILWVIIILKCRYAFSAVSYTHLTLPTNREV